MVINVKFKSIFVSTKSNLSKDGSKTYYSIGLENNGSVGMVNCSSEVFQEMVNRSKFTEVIFVGEYNDVYKSFRIISVE